MTNIIRTQGAPIIALYRDRDSVYQEVTAKAPGQEIFNSGLHGSYSLVPKRDFYATVDMWGAGGGGSHSGGGSHTGSGGGGFTTGKVLFQRNILHTIWVGEGGRSDGQNRPIFGGGGLNHSAGGSGGGLSGIFINNQVNRTGALLIAGGGGGGGHSGNGHHGNGGGGGGLSGNSAHAGSAGSQTGNGGGGYGNSRGGHGIFEGGRCTQDQSHIGGGGGGWYGGGGGGHAGPNHYNGGSGGSGHFVGASGTENADNYGFRFLVTDASTNAAPQTNSGSNWQGGNPANPSDPRRGVSGQGRENQQVGGDGRVIITMLSER